MRFFCLLSSFAFLWLFSLSPALAQNYVIEDLRIPMSAAGPQGLEGLIVHPSGNGPFPLALISHGSPRDDTERPQMTPQEMLPQMMEFARRGFTAATVMRRGYGASGGSWAESFGPCDHADYLDAGRASAAVALTQAPRTRHLRSATMAPTDGARAPRRRRRQPRDARSLRRARGGVSRLRRGRWLYADRGKPFAAKSFAAQLIRMKR